MASHVETMEVPTEERLNSAGCEIFFACSCPSQISKMNSTKMHLEILPLKVPTEECLDFYGGIVTSPGIFRPNLIAGGGHFLTTHERTVSANNKFKTLSNK